MSLLLDLLEPLPGYLRLLPTGLDPAVALVPGLAPPGPILLQELVQDRSVVLRVVYRVQTSVVALTTGL